MKECPDILSIWSWNINGLNASSEKGALKEFVDEAKFDILCLNETKTDLSTIRTKKFNLIIPEGYE